MPLPISQLQGTLLAKQLQYQAVLDQARVQAQQQAIGLAQEGGESSRRMSQTQSAPIYQMIGAEQQQAEGQAKERVRQEQMTREDEERAFQHMMSQKGMGLQEQGLDLNRDKFNLDVVHTGFEEDDVLDKRAWESSENAMDRAAYAGAGRGAANEADSQLNAMANAVRVKYDSALDSLDKELNNQLGAQGKTILPAQRAGYDVRINELRQQRDAISAEKQSMLDRVMRSSPLTSGLFQGGPPSYAQSTSAAPVAPPSVTPVPDPQAAAPTAPDEGFFANFGRRYVGTITDWIRGNDEPASPAPGVAPPPAQPTGQVDPNLFSRIRRGAQ